MQHKYPVTDELSLPELADPKWADLSLTEVTKYDGYRTIGGDKGDLRFEGYILDEDDGRTIVYKPVLLTGLEGLTPDEVNDIAREILEFSYESVGIECVEHN